MAIRRRRGGRLFRLGRGGGIGLSSWSWGRRRHLGARRGNSRLRRGAGWRGNLSRRCGWFWRRGRFRRCRPFRLNTPFPGRAGVHLRGQASGLPFFLEVGGSLVGRFAGPYHIVPRIHLGADLTFGLRTLEIQRDRIASIGAEIDMHTADIFKQRSHTPPGTDMMPQEVRGRQGVGGTGGFRCSPRKQALTETGRYGWRITGRLWRLARGHGRLNSQAPDESYSPRSVSHRTG